MGRGVDLTAASARHDDARRWGCKGLWARGTLLPTGIAMWLMGEARQGWGGTVALGRWGGRGRRWRRTHGGGALGHIHWSRTHSHTRAMSPSGETKRAETMTNPLPQVVQEG